MKDHDSKHLVERGYDSIAQCYLECAQRTHASEKPSAGTRPHIQRVTVSICLCR